MHRYVSGFPDVDIDEVYRLGGILFSRKLWEIEKEVEVGRQYPSLIHCSIIRLHDDYDYISRFSAATHQLATVHEVDGGGPLT
jgi:hypothetical protein